MDDRKIPGESDPGRQTPMTRRRLNPFARSSGKKVGKINAVALARILRRSDVGDRRASAFVSEDQGAAGSGYRPGFPDQRISELVNHEFHSWMMNRLRTSSDAEAPLEEKIVKASAKPQVVHSGSSGTIHAGDEANAEARQDVESVEEQFNEQELSEIRDIVVEYVREKMLDTPERHLSYIRSKIARI